MAGSSKSGTIAGHIGTALWNSLRNRYLLSNIVYAAYASAMLYIDYKLLPEYNAAYAACGSSSTSSYSSSGSYSTDSSSTDVAVGCSGPSAKSIQDQMNLLYLVFGVVHFINSFMYYWSWLPSGYRYYDRVMIPEYLNMIGAAMYLKTAILYPSIASLDYTDLATLYVHDLELAASTIEVVASLGWAYTWWLTYPRGPGRGWTLDDPDLWGILFIVIPSWAYMAYNVQIRLRPEEYGSNELYAYADILYAVGSYAYLLASLRDDGWFWWAPLAGRLPGGIDDVVPFPPRGDAQEATDGVVGSCLGLDCGCGGRGGAKGMLLPDTDVPLIAGSGSGHYRYGDGRA